MRLRVLIDERGLRHNWVAHQLGISTPMLSLCLQGKRRFTRDKIRPLAKLLRVPASEIERAINGAAK